MASEAPRGALRINDEIEVGYDEGFERTWRHVELLSHALMAAVVLAALAGLLGRGPFSHRTHYSAGGGLAVDFEPIARFDTTTQVTLHLSNRFVSPVRVALSSGFFEPLGLQQIIPAPSNSEVKAGGAVYSFLVPSGAHNVLVRFVLKPGTVGPVQLKVASGADVLSWTMWIVP